LFKVIEVAPGAVIAGALWEAAKYAFAWMLPYFHYDLLYGSIGAAVAGLVETLAEALLKPFTLSSGVSDETARKREIEPQVQTIINNINPIIADVETRANKPLMILVDGLDKLRRPEQAQLIFLDNSALRGPICRMICSVPMLIYNSPQFNQVEEECKSYLLPNVKTVRAQRRSKTARAWLSHNE
jgi:hypothetical protein